MSVLTASSDARGHFASARAYAAKSKHREAAGAWVTGLQIDPAYLPGHLALTQSLLALGMSEAAVTAAKHAVMASPESADAHELMGQVSEACGQRSEAIESYTRSLTLRPNRQRVCHRLCGVLRAEGRLKAARRVLEKLLESNPHDPGSWFLLAGIVADMGAIGIAIEHLRKAVALQPRFPEALNTLAVLLRASGDLTEAETCFRRALSQRANYAPAWNNLANLHVEMARVEEAERCYSQAIRHQPDYAEAHTNRALVRLLQGKFKEGLDEYEWRWRQAGTGVRTLPRPEWDGGPLQGKTILLHAEQGAGDTIQFIRYARVLKERGATVILHCQESLQTLLSGMPELTAVICGHTTAPEFDVHAPLMSLPRLLGTTEETIPADVPYLRSVEGVPVPERLSSAPGLRVGLVWAGNPGHRNDRNRSCAVELLGGLLKTSGAHFFSLQVGQQAPPPAIDLAPHLTDYAVTAACLTELDLLITVDTSVGHLAGALGRPVWMLLPVSNDWRWLRGRLDTPWYATMRLFRQSSWGDWKPVLRDVEQALKQLTV